MTRVDPAARRRLAAALRVNLRRFGKLADQTARQPIADRVHDLRVITRRIRADFWLVPRSHRRRAIRRARRDLERLAAILGEQRKYDVALEDAQRFRTPTRPIERRLKVARRNVMRALCDKDRRRVVRHLDRAIEDFDRLDDAIFTSRIATLAERLEAAQRHPPKTNAGRHRLRINVKKARYLLDATRRPAAQLERLQDHLGRWHDLMVLSGVSGRKTSVTAACAREWRLADRCLQPALRQATRQLSGLIERPPFRFPVASLSRRRQMASATLAGRGRYAIPQSGRSRRATRETPRAIQRPASAHSGHSTWRSADGCARR